MTRISCENTECVHITSLKYCTKENVIIGSKWIYNEPMVYVCYSSVKAKERRTPNVKEY